VARAAAHACIPRAAAPQPGAPGGWARGAHAGGQGAPRPTTANPPRRSPLGSTPQCGSALFVVLLGGDAPLSAVVPLANATSLAANAAADLALGEAFSLPLLLPGLALVAGGLLLCATGAG
jgi:hypothetical protein